MSRAEGICMKVLMIHNSYAARSGEEDAAQALADLLGARGHDILWFRRSSAEISGSCIGNIKAFFAGIHNPFAAAALARRLDETRPDIVQIQNLYPLLSPAILRPIRARGIPIVMRCPNYRLFCPTGLYLRRGRVCEQCVSRGGELWCIVHNCENSLAKSTGYAVRSMWARLTRSIVRCVDMFIVQTPFQLQKFVERGIPEARVAIVPGFVVSDRCPSWSDAADSITFVGRVSPEKGVEDFIHAARMMPEVPFAVAGSDVTMPGIRKRSPANVRWLGFLQSDALYDTYLKSRIVVVPSRWYEGFPNVAVQAMVCARPVVAARIGALISIVDDGRTGLHFEPGNPSDLAGKLRYLYRDPSLCRELGGNARLKAAQYYSADAAYRALMDAYERATDQHVQKSGFALVQSRHFPVAGAECGGDK